MPTPEHRPEPAGETELALSPEIHPESPPAGNLPSAAAAAADPPDADRPAPGGRIPIYRDFTLLQLAVIFFLLDQLTKFLARAYLPYGYSWPWRGFFRFTHTENTGSIFGILQGQNTPLIFVSCIGILVLIMVYYSQPRPTNLLRFSLALQLGGAFGNLLDRLRLGAVTDFIDVGPWPVFNLADASIVTGLLLLVWVLLRSGGQSDSTATPTPAAAETADPAGAETAADPVAADIPPDKDPPL